MYQRFKCKNKIFKEQILHLYYIKSFDVEILLPNNRNHPEAALKKD